MPAGHPLECIAPALGAVRPALHIGPLRGLNFVARRDKRPCGYTLP
jgi:hypothetical protein